MSAIALENKMILVTGAAGFIGSNLVKRICEEVPSAKVVGIDSVNDYYDVALKEFRLNELSKYESFTFIKGNIANKELITEIFTKYKPAVVVNLAAQAGVRYSITNPDAYVEANLIGFYNILEACRHSYDDGETGVEHLVCSVFSAILQRALDGNLKYLDRLILVGCLSHFQDKELILDIMKQQKNYKEEVTKQYLSKLGKSYYPVTIQYMYDLYGETPEPHLNPQMTILEYIADKFGFRVHIQQNLYEEKQIQNANRKIKKLSDISEFQMIMYEEKTLYMNDNLGRLLKLMEANDISHNKSELFQCEKRGRNSVYLYKALWHFQIFEMDQERIEKFWRLILQKHYLGMVEETETIKQYFTDMQELAETDGILVLAKESYGNDSTLHYLYDKFEHIHGERSYLSWAFDEGKIKRYLKREEH